MTQAQLLAEAKRLTELYKEKREAEKAAFAAMRICTQEKLSPDSMQRLEQALDRYNRAREALGGESLLEEFWRKAAPPWRYSFEPTLDVHSVVAGAYACSEPGCTIDHAYPIVWDVGEAQARLIVEAVNHLFAQHEAEKS